MLICLNKINVDINRSQSMKLRPQAISFKIFIFWLMIRVPGTSDQQVQAEQKLIDAFPYLQKAERLRQASFKRRSRNRVKY
jgi:hypothetical protein